MECINWTYERLGWKEGRKEGRKEEGHMGSIEEEEDRRGRGGWEAKGCEEELINDI